MKQNILITIYAILFIVFALLWNKEKWRRVYFENRLDYCFSLITAVKSNDQIEIEEAFNRYEYGCTRQK